MRPSHAVVEKPAADFFKQVTGPWCFFQAVLPADAPSERPPPPAAWVNPLAREQASKGGPF